MTCMSCGAGLFVDRRCPNYGSSDIADPPRWWIRCLESDHNAWKSEQSEGLRWICDSCGRNELVQAEVEA